MRRLPLQYFFFQEPPQLLRWAVLSLKNHLVGHNFSYLFGEKATQLSCMFTNCLSVRQNVKALLVLTHSQITDLFFVPQVEVRCLIPNGPAVSLKKKKQLLGFHLLECGVTTSSSAASNLQLPNGSGKLFGFVDGVHIAAPALRSRSTRSTRIKLLRRRVLPARFRFVVLGVCCFCFCIFDFFLV